MDARAVKILALGPMLAGGNTAVAGHPCCQDGMLSLRAHPLPDLLLEPGHKSVN